MRIQTQLVMTGSAIALAGTGLALTFLPEEIATHISTGATAAPPIVFQILGALYFAFAMLNWMARGSVIGGIYNRPIAIANFTHFFIGAMALIKLVSQETSHPAAMLAITGVYALFTLLYVIILYTNPVKAQQA